jgi:methyltransferase-like protein
MGMAGAATLYDEVLYPAGVYPQTHPNRLATIGVFRGMRPAPIDRCRVLELGCGAASNLTGIAFHLPESEFVGLDQARRPIASGQKFIAGLGLTNINLHAIDVSDATAERFGTFDFIIAHGLYSWVPQSVRERVLAICREMLNPQGIAYISYNAYPGNHLRDLVRWMMRFHTSSIEDPTDKTGQARGLLKVLAASKSKPDYYVDAIRAQFDRLVKYPDEAFFHDDLSEINQPFYFYEFMTDAARHGLKFVGEARANDLALDLFSAEIAKTMDQLQGAPEIVQEQYKDFIRGCAFRETILCHQEVEVSPDLLAERVPEVYALCDAQPVENNDDSRTLFRRSNGSEVAAADPLIGAALKFVCSQWPCSVPFETALAAANAAASRELAAPREDLPGMLAAAFAKVYRAGFLHLNVHPFDCVNRVSERPATSALVRFQLEIGSAATNQLHVSMKFPDPLSRRMVSLLDGTRDQPMLVRELAEYVKSGRGRVSENGIAIEDPDEILVVLEQRVREGLDSLAREGMLVA